ncbi:MAG: esterase, partial [Marivirga sp.]|nr:esterase [Marivirga sp.]
ETAYEGMATDAALALKWVKENIAIYGGNDQRIFISGHSAGGHLAALISADNHYFDSLNIDNPIQGAILIDAFGLDMYSFLSNGNYEKNKTYYAVFTKDPGTWKRGSPINYVSKTIPPLLIFTGGKTYPAIKESSKSFHEAVRFYHPDTQMILFKNKKHVAMITQFLNSGNKAYKHIIAFIKTNKD